MPPATLPAALQELAVARHSRYLEAAEAADLRLHELTALPGDAARVFACSAFVSGTLERHPGLLHELLESGDLNRAYSEDGEADDPLTAGKLPPIAPDPALTARFEQALWTEVGTQAEPGTDHADREGRAALDEIDAMARLRRLRRREWIRLAWRDIAGLSTVRGMMAEASAFADAALRFSLDVAQNALSTRYGDPLDSRGKPARLVVLALGKLGAGELNFSSDIDLIFAYPGAGETTGGRRSLSANEYFLRLGRQLIKLLTHMTPDGTVFRVDMRLRPFGDGGPLVMSFDAMEEYYQNHGRDWERYALIRARPICAGDAPERLAAEDLVRRLRPFIYRRYLDFGTLELLRDMKRNMTEEVKRRGLHDNVKLGPGGIREIEFTAQAFQMVRGGRIGVLQDRCLLRVLPLLKELSLLPDFAVNQLHAAYQFLRAAEHRLQEMDDRQVHELPDDDQTRQVLASAMGFADWRSFRTELDRHREHVHAQFVQVFGETEGETPAMPEPLRSLLAPSTDPEQGEALLRSAGFANPDEAWPTIAAFKNVYDVRLLDGAGERRLQQLLPDLLRAVAAQRDPLETLRRVLGVIQAVVRRSAYLSLLAERPLSLSQLVILCAASPWIARQLARHPALLDLLLDTRDLYAPMTPEGLSRDLASRLDGVTAGDLEEEMEQVRQFKHAAVLRVAAADLAEKMPLMRVSDHLTDIAEVVLRQALAVAWRDLSARHGEPVYEQGGERRVARFAVIAYGKLGGIELGYGSDLDVVFVYDGPNGIATDGRRAIDIVVFFQRLGQRIIHFLNTATPAGTLYEVDSRLRPSGNKGPLVVRLPALSEYLNKDAWTWEHQALVRARVVAGDGELAEQLKALRASILCRERDPRTLKQEVRDMRAKMRAALGTGRAAQFDIKQDAGGIADIEFMVQYCVLRWAGRLGRWLEFTDNIRLLEGLAETGLIPGDDARKLTSIYQTFRSAVHTQALQERDGVVDNDAFVPERAVIQRVWDQLLENEPRS